VKRRVTDATPQREEKRTETTAEREGITVRIVTLQLLNGGRHNLKVTRNKKNDNGSNDDDDDDG